jgi:cell shape-determining protein MreC
VDWRRQRDEGRLDGRARGRKGKDPKDVEIEQLRRENSRLRRRLEQAQTVIEVQKKLSQALGIERETSEDDERR